MAIKFYFKPQAPNFAQMALGLLTGTTSMKDALMEVLKYSKGQFMLPVNPEEVTITTTNDVKSTNVVEKGQVLIPKGVNLATLTIESFFPKYSAIVTQLLTGRIPQYMNLETSALFQMFTNFTGEQCFQYFEKLQRSKVPVRLVITDCYVDMDVIVTSIEKRYVGGDEDIHYKLELSEYNYHTLKPVEFKVKTLVDLAKGAVKKVAATKPAQRPKTEFVIGDKVIVNGKYFYDSFGSSPFGTFKDFHGKISHKASNKNATHKYHITTLSGGWRGWVKVDQLQEDK